MSAAALEQSGGRDDVAAGSRGSPGARDSRPEANASAGRTNHATTTDREAHSAHAERGSCGEDHANHAREIGRDANGAHRAALHRAQGVAMRGRGQPGAARADVLLYTAQIRNRHHD